MADARRAHAAQAERAEGRDEAAGIDMDGDASMHRPSADTIPIDRGVVTRGRDGRFSSTAASFSGSSKRSRSVEDDWVVKDPVPGGPFDGAVIPSFLGHIACAIWAGQDMGVLRCHTRSGYCTKLRLWYSGSSRTIQSRIESSGLFHLPGIMHSHIDAALITAFVERWQPDTSSFHMPFDGAMVTADATVDELKECVMDLFGATRVELDSRHYASGGIRAASIMERCGGDRIPETQAIAWTWLMLGSTLFVDKSGDRIRPSCLLEVQDSAAGAVGLSWGSAALAYLYRHLGIATRGDCGQMTGCMTLLQSWIYEYFPCFRPHREAVTVDPDLPRASLWPSISMEKSDERLRAFRARLDVLTADEVMWMPYGPDAITETPRTLYSGWIRYRDVIEPYMPGRCLRQLGHVQTIPRPILQPSKAVRPWTSLKYRVEVPAVMVQGIWDSFPQSSVLILSVFTPAHTPSDCEDQYMHWYTRHSHPRLLPEIVAPGPAVYTRSNSEIWVSRLSGWGETVLDHMSHLDEDAAIVYRQSLEEIMDAWHLAK
ncbi:protein MAINTENANCE OF MERISTEMS-like [Euphorbia lathyris]|uniref:protein MAINTENANCE OF MERISTEMS-like n=4 Tax=Euphorbia lathyris TaxID=212925 RepID=UPI0033137DD2